MEIIIIMDLIGMMDGLSHGLADLSMFPYFEMAHYTVSVMALREQPGKEKVRDVCGSDSSALKKFGAEVVKTSSRCTS